MNANSERDGESLAVDNEAAPMPREMAEELVLLSRPGSASRRQDEHVDDDDASKQQRSGSSGGAKNGLATLFNSSRSGSIEGSLLLSSQPGTLLPTLSEEERDNDDDDANEGDVSDDRDGPESPSPLHAPLSTLGERYCTSNDSELIDEHDNRHVHSHECGEEADGGATFHAMLRGLSTDASLLALSIDDVTPHRLIQVREALHNCAPHLQQDEEDRQDASPSTAPSRLARVRTMVAVDTLRLLLERFRPLDVRRAVDASIRAVFSEASASSGVASLAKASSVLTTRNIARVVPMARQQLMDHSGGGSDHRPAKHPSKPRLELAKSLLLHTRGPHAAPSSPSSRASKASPPALSVRTSGSTSPATTRRPTSILAMEGDHLLLQEKLARFEHRGPSPVSGSVPKVRRDGDESSEAAAKRRQRALEYAARQRKLNLTY